MKKVRIGISIIVVVVALVVFGFIFSSQHPVVTDIKQSINSKTSAADEAGQNLSGGHCTGTDKPKLTHLPMRAEDFAFILPYGLMTGGHVTPVDHQYFSPIVFDSLPSTYDVYAMADSRLVDIQTRQHPGQGQNKNIIVTDYRLVFSISCRLFYYYDLVNSLVPGLEEQFNSWSWPNRKGVEVKSGQLIGKIGGQTLDFAVWDTDKPLNGFIDPAHYYPETWKLYTVDPLDYYTDDVKAAVLAKYVRTAEPRSGKIDYDVDGKLIGNWFEKGTRGYNGLLGEGNGDYWTGHLSFSPYFLDPEEFLVSIGAWPKPDGASQYATKTGMPNPANVDISTSLVKYDLVRFSDLKANGQRWDNMTFASPVTLAKQSFVEGCILVQMTGTRSLKAEAFKRQACSDVRGFTSAAKVYER